MSFESALKTTRLPEKPWQLGGIARLVVGIVIAILMGTVAAITFRYFETPQDSSAILFLSLATGAIGSLMGGLILLWRPWPPLENYLARLIWLLSCIYGGILLTWFAGRLITGKLDLQSPILGILLTLLFFQGAAVVLVHFFLRDHHVTWSDGFGLKNRPAASFLIGLCVGALALYPVVMLQDLSIQVLQRLTLQAHEQQVVEILRRAAGWTAHIVVGIGTILVAPIGEELLFRGIFYPAAKKRFGQQVALWGTSILFGAIHLNMATFLPLTILAVILVCVYEYTGNLIAPITVHCFFNAANFVALYYQQN